jgi:hypothetical protein
MAVDDPVFSGTSSTLTPLTSDIYKKERLDQFGPFAIKEDRTNQNGVATIYYPDSQMYFDVVFAASGAAISGSTTGTQGGSLGNVLVKDTETSSMSGKNLIVVGGSCINSLAASLLGGTACGSAFTTKTGVAANQFLIQSFANPYSSSNVALVVAGWEAGDTVNAATYLTTNTVDTTVGKKYKGTSATSASLVVS